MFDWKTGWSDVAPAEENVQLRAGALAACRTYGRSRAIVGIIRVHDDEEPFVDQAELGPFELEAFATELRELGKEVFLAREAVKRGALPRLSIGRHCQWCPAIRVCPAQAGALRAFKDDDTAGGLIPPQPMSLEAAGVAYEIAEGLRLRLQKIIAACYAVAKKTPIPLSNGEVLGEVTTKRDSLAGPVVRAVMHKLYGPEVADAAVEYSATKKRLKEALRMVAKERDVPLAPLEREALAAISEAGGVTTKWSTTIRPHRPKGLTGRKSA